MATTTTTTTTIPTCTHKYVHTSVSSHTRVNTSVADVRSSCTRAHARSTHSLTRARGPSRTVTHLRLHQEHVKEMLRRAQDRLQDTYISTQAEAEEVLEAAEQHRSWWSRVVGGVSRRGSVELNSQKAPTPASASASSSAAGQAPPPDNGMYAESNEASRVYREGLGSVRRSTSSVCTQRRVVVNRAVCACVCVCVCV
jgi:hypothetical protein